MQRLPPLNFLQQVPQNDPTAWIDSARQGFSNGYQNAQQALRQSQQQKLLEELINPQVRNNGMNYGMAQPQNMQQNNQMLQAAQNAPMMPRRDDMAFVQEQLRNRNEDPRQTQVARALAAQGLIAAPRIVEDKENGRETSVYTLPNGQQIVDTRITGPGAVNNAFLKDSTESSEGSRAILEHLDQLENIMKSNSDIVANAVGPLNQYKPSAVSSPDTRKMQGQISALSGLITAAAAKGFKGAFTGREQDLLGQIKPNLSDNIEAFQGKISALKTALSVGEQRNTLIRQLVRQNVPPEEAVAYAHEQIKMPESVYGATRASENLGALESAITGVENFVKPGTSQPKSNGKLSDPLGIRK